MLASWNQVPSDSLGRQSVAWRPADMGLMQVIGSEAKINCARRTLIYKHAA